MVDNIKLNKILPSLLPARKVQGADPRERNSQQSPFKKSLERKQKKKKKADSGHVRVSEGKSSMSAVLRSRQADGMPADKPGQLDTSSRSRIIDIRV